MQSWDGTTFEADACVRCGGMAVTDDVGYCGHCHWAVRAEIVEGLYDLRRYLTRWAEFREWEAAQHRPPESTAGDES
jgi:ribosomal protein S27AE